MTGVAKWRIAGILLALAIYAFDQVIKVHVTRTLGINEIGLYRELLPFFDLRFTRNFGVSLGMFQANSPETRWMLVAATATIALIVGIWMLREKLAGDILALALILGGAMGNIHDRALVGYVIDYADLHFGTFRPFLIFNLADAAITIGVLIVLARAFLVSDKSEPSDTPSAAPLAAETDR